MFSLSSFFCESTMFSRSVSKPFFDTDATPSTPSSLLISSSLTNDEISPLSLPS